MNRIGAIALFVAATMISAGSAAAESNTFEVNVPFNFTVNNTSLPAGIYTIGVDVLHPDVLILRDRTKSVKASGLGERGPIGAGKPRTLIFHGYDGQYFLSEVRFESTSDGIFLPATRSERRARNVNREAILVSVGGALLQGPGNRSVAVSGKAAF
ncbi:MAG: hypothetical protein WBE72_00140 [Terracidiphilus sp.]